MEFKVPERPAPGFHRRIIPHYHATLGQVSADCTMNGIRTVKHGPRLTIEQNLERAGCASTICLQSKPGPDPPPGALDGGRGCVYQEAVVDLPAHRRAEQFIYRNGHGNPGKATP
ncbi:hypothetical protein PBS_02620 [Paraburkholderia sp. 2C]